MAIYPEQRAAIGLGGRIMTEHVEWYDRTWQLAAGAGGAIAFALLHQPVPTKRMLAMVFVGGVSSTFLSPWICDLAGMQDRNALAAVSFLTGLLGLVGTTNIISLAEKHATGFLSKLMEKLFGAPLPTQAQVVAEEVLKQLPLEIKLPVNPSPESSVGSPPKTQEPK